MGASTLSPTVHRPEPPYIQVVGHIRDQIMSGQLRDGDMIPSARKIAQEWQISLATATKVLGSLRAEGLVRAMPGVGTMVSASDAIHRGPRDRVASIRRTGRIYPPDQHATITVAELVNASAEIADSLSVEAGMPIIRRHRITYRGEVPVSASTSWFAGALAEVAPQLLQKQELPQGTPAYIEQTTGRAATTGRDQMAAGAASGQVAEDLAVQPGTPVLYGRNWLYDADGAVIEYGESCTLADRWLSYDYMIGDQAP